MTNDIESVLRTLIVLYLNWGAGAGPKSVSSHLPLAQKFKLYCDVNSLKPS